MNRELPFCLGLLEFYGFGIWFFWSWLGINGMGFLYVYLLAMLSGLVYLDLDETMNALRD